MYFTIKFNLKKRKRNKISSRAWKKERVTSLNKSLERKNGHSTNERTSSLFHTNIWSLFIPGETDTNQIIYRKSLCFVKMSLQSHVSLWNFYCSNIHKEWIRQSDIRKINYQPIKILVWCHIVFFPFVETFEYFKEGRIERLERKRTINKFIVLFQSVR